MRRFGLLFVALALVLVGFGAVRSAPSGVAQEGTPEAMAARCPSPLATPTAAPVASPMSTPTGETVCVGVLEGEYYVRSERTTFQMGQPYTFAVGNAGQEVHEFVIEPAGEVDAPLEAEENGEEREAEIEDIAPGQTAELEWTFTQPGHYQFACHIPLHFEEGMVIEVEVVE